MMFKNLNSSFRAASPNSIVIGNYIPSGKTVRNELKNHKSACACPMFQPERTYGSLTQQLDTVVIEISVLVLRLRANPQRLQGPNICHQ